MIGRKNFGSVVVSPGVPMRRPAPLHLKRFSHQVLLGGLADEVVFVAIVISSGHVVSILSLDSGGKLNV